MHFKPFIKLYSCVSGGPLERMSRGIKERGINSSFVAAFKPEQWRDLFSKGKMGRLLARALSFGVYPLQGVGAAIKASFGAKPFQRPVLVVSTNPFIMPHIMVLTKCLHRCSVVALMYDMYPDALEAAGISKPWLSKIMTIANKWTIEHADAVVHIGEVLKENVEKRYGTNPKTYVIPNGASQAEFKDVPKALPDELHQWMEGRVIFSYVGNMGLMHDVETLEKAIPEFISTCDENLKKHVGFIFAATGPGESRLRRSFEGKFDDNVKFIGALPDAEWADLLAHSDVSMATLTEMAHATCAPSKMYSAIAAHSIPLAVGPKSSDLSYLINGSHKDESQALMQDPGNRCGIMVDPGDVKGLVDAFSRLLDEGDRYIYMDNLLKVANENDIASIVQKWMDCIHTTADSSIEPWSEKIYHLVKRIFDITASISGLSVLSPIMIATAIAVYFKLGSPILFRQQRPGLDGKPFELLKFRSMANAPEGTDASHDGERLSEFGKKIRALSLDELPTLLNVLKGDMSLVGPRPLLMSYIKRYNDHQIKRQWVKPGVTGWAQVNGRNALSWDEKFDMDVWYVENASILLDLKILFKTIYTVFNRSGINHSNSATMPEFMGNEVKDAK